MQLDHLFNNVFNSVEHVKTIFVRKDGKLKKVTRPVKYTRHPDEDSTIKNKPLFPISKDRGASDESKED
jgi:hypothetical protein